jgi:hypothetical protein
VMRDDRQAREDDDGDREQNRKFHGSEPQTKTHCSVVSSARLLLWSAL